MVVTVSDFYCTKCGRKGIPVARKRSKQRKERHLKKLFCLNCKDETNHIEIRPFDYRYTVEDFKQELEAGIFLEEK